MFAKLKDFIVKNKLYVGIGSGALVLCVAVGIVLRVWAAAVSPY